MRVVRADGCVRAEMVREITALQNVAGATAKRIDRSEQTTALSGSSLSTGDGAETEPLTESLVTIGLRGRSSPG
jgi:hypothetical protein